MTLLRICEKILNVVDTCFEGKGGLACIPYSERETRLPIL